MKQSSIIRNNLETPFRHQVILITDNDDTELTHEALTNRDCNTRRLALASLTVLICGGVLFLFVYLLANWDELSRIS